jgi:hypothetical protein
MQNPNFALERRSTATEPVVNWPRQTLLLNNWARQDSNLGPRDYESPALTAELQAPRDGPKIKAFRPVTNPESIRGSSSR